MGAGAVWALVGGLAVWIVLAMRSGDAPSSMWLWLKRPKNAARAIRVSTWVVAAALAGVTWIVDQQSELGGWRKEFTVVALTVAGIEEVSRLRARQEYKQSIIRQMASRSNDFALDATRIAMDEGWLNDGSLKGADLPARLEEAVLFNADIKEATHIEEAIVFNANPKEVAHLEGAVLRGARLEKADLRGVHLEKADLFNANLKEAVLPGRVSKRLTSAKHISKRLSCSRHISKRQN